MRALVGLGNPGRRYSHTLHNLGFEVIERLARRWRIRLTKKRGSLALMGEGSVAGNTVILLKPMTFMNASGEALRPLLRHGSLKVEDFFVLIPYKNLLREMGLVE